MLLKVTQVLTTWPLPCEKTLFSIAANKVKIFIQHVEKLKCSKLHLRDISSCHRKYVDVTVGVASCFSRDECFFANSRVSVGLCHHVWNYCCFLSTLLFLFLCDTPVNFWLTQLITNFKYSSLHSITKPYRSRSMSFVSQADILELLSFLAIFLLLTLL